MPENPCSSDHCCSPFWQQNFHSRGVTVLNSTRNCCQYQRGCATLQKLMSKLSSELRSAFQVFARRMPRQLLPALFTYHNPVTGGGTKRGSCPHHADLGGCGRKAVVLGMDRFIDAAAATLYLARRCGVSAGKAGKSTCCSAAACASTWWWTTNSANSRRPDTPVLSKIVRIIFFSKGTVVPICMAISEFR